MGKNPELRWRKRNVVCTLRCRIISRNTNTTQPRRPPKLLCVSIFLLYMALLIRSSTISFTISLQTTDSRDEWNLCLPFHERRSLNSKISVKRDPIIDKWVGWCHTKADRHGHVALRAPNTVNDSRLWSDKALKSSMIHLRLEFPYEDVIHGNFLRTFVTWSF